MTVTTPLEALTPGILTAPDTMIDATSDITTLDQLVRHLKQAAYLEMSTVPMYLYSAFSIGSRGYSQWDPGMGAFRLIRSIVVEEMLHLSLVRNLLVALGKGDEVTFYQEDFVPTYPSYMLHRWPLLDLHLGPCSRELVRDVFMEFERPSAKPGEGTPPEGWYATIGKFYEAVGKGLKYLDGTTPDLWKRNQPHLQYVAAYWNKDGGGEPVLVQDLKSALDALKIIVEQGEGIPKDKLTVPINPLKPIPGLDEMPHYIKFKRIADGVEPIGPVWPLPMDPKAGQYGEDEAVTSINTLFNAVYCYVLHMLDVIYGTSRSDVKPGATSPRYHYERTFMSAMQGILVTVAETMVAVQVNSSVPIIRHAGPTFEFHRLPATGKKKYLLQLCDAAMAHFPQLGGDNSVRWLIGKLPDAV
ncbi:ferritin-like protein [Kitasatospora xanthocidica]|uniref:ferritin-like domain-containing protein n=1 Tax=Kitasatospora xanthocidica TaxID=83382 RepID=UPI0036EFC516